MLFVCKRPKINEKEAGDGKFKKQYKVMVSSREFLNILPEWDPEYRVGRDGLGVDELDAVGQTQDGRNSDLRDEEAAQEQQNLVQ